MKTNFYMESQQFCYGYEEYLIEEFNEKKYIIPKKGTKRRVTALADGLNEAMLDILNIGKKYYYNEEVSDAEILDFTYRHGLFGFMSDFSINRYYVLDDTVALRDYNLLEYKDYVSTMNLKDYLKIFMPKSTEKQIETLIEKCKKNIKPTIMEKYLTPELNELLIFSENYAEPVYMFEQYAKLLYTTLNNILENKYAFTKLDTFKINNLSNNIDRINSLGICLKYNYLKQGIDLNMIIHLSQDIRMLKICKFCHKPFIAANQKAEYDSPLCKNKSNVYKFRQRAQEENKN